MRRTDKSAGVQTSAAGALCPASHLPHLHRYTEGKQKLAERDSSVPHIKAADHRTAVSNLTRNLAPFLLLGALHRETSVLANKEAILYQAQWNIGPQSPAFVSDELRNVFLPESKH